MQLLQEKQSHKSDEMEWIKKKEEIVTEWELNKADIEKELNDLKRCIEVQENSNCEVKKEVEKVKKEKVKLEKEHIKIKEIKCELRKSLDEARARVQENVKLAEEKKTLQGIIKMNTELYEKQKEEEKKKNQKEVIVKEIVDEKNL